MTAHALLANVAVTGLLIGAVAHSPTLLVVLGGAVLCGCVWWMVNWRPW